VTAVYRSISNEIIVNAAQTAAKSDATVFDGDIARLNFYN
jgi:hypothetical protein